MRQLTGGRKTNQNSNESSLKMQKSSLEFQEISIFDIQLSKGFQEMIHFSRKLTITICTLSEQSAIRLKGNLKCINGNSLSPLGAESKEIPAALRCFADVTNWGYSYNKSKLPVVSHFLQHKNRIARYAILVMHYRIISRILEAHWHKWLTTCPERNQLNISHSFASKTEENRLVMIISTLFNCSFWVFKFDSDWYLILRFHSQKHETHF